MLGWKFVSVRLPKLKKFKLKRSFTTVALVIAGLVIASCAGGKPSDSSPSRSQVAAVVRGRGAVQSDGDADNPGDLDGNGDVDGSRDLDNDSRTAESYEYPDSDDRSTFVYGVSPTPSEGASIARVVKRYFRAASVTDGSNACVLLSPSIAKSMPEDYGTGSTAYLRGSKTCAEVMNKLLQHNHRQLSQVPQILSVRLNGNIAQVVIGSANMPASLVHLQRQGTAWYLLAPLGRPLP